MTNNLLLFRLERLDVPDTLSVFFNTPVAREEPHAADACDALGNPVILILVGFIDECLRLDVTIEVVADKIVIAVIRNGANKGRECVLVAKLPSSDSIKDLV